MANAEYPTYTEHAAHGPWEKVGRCVYCSCGMRLYQGEAPDGPAEQTTMGEMLDELATAAIKKVRDERSG